MTGEKNGISVMMHEFTFSDMDGKSVSVEIAK